MGVGTKRGFISGVTAITAAATFLAASGVPAMAATNTEYEGKGYASAEEAIKAYAEAFADKDLNAMVETFAIETMVDNYDLAAQLDQLGSYVPQVSLTLPDDNEMVHQLLIEQRQGDVADAILYEYNVLTDTGTYKTEGQNIQFKDDYDSAEDFIDEELSGGRDYDSSEIEVGDIITPDALTDKYSMDSNTQTLAKYADIYGADEITDNAITLTINGEDYLLFMESICYDGVWYNYRAFGNLASLCGLSAYTGGLAKASVSEIAQISGGTGQTQASVNTNKKSSANWQQAYYDFLMEYCTGEQYPRTFALVYIDNDDIPELVMDYNGTDRTAQVSLYTYYNNKVTELGQVGSYSTLNYVEKKNQIVEVVNSGMNQTTNVYEIKKGKLQKSSNTSYSSSKLKSTPDISFGETAYRCNKDDIALVKSNPSKVTL